MSRTALRPSGVVRFVSLLAVFSGLLATGVASSEITFVCPPCPDDGDPCTLDECDPATLLCTHYPPPNCDDHNICTIDTCTGPFRSDCAHSTPPNCDDGNICTIDTCTGPNPGDCAHSTPPDCNDNNVCTLDACTGPNEGDCSHSGNSCDDGNLCTIDTCTGPNPGDCAHSTPPNCDDGNVSTIDACTGPNEGDCSHSDIRCDDGNVCTIDTYTGPGPEDCAHSTPPNCDDGDVCTIDECTGPNPGDCRHSTPPDCDDQNVCTMDQCISSTECAHSTPPNCDDGNVCTYDYCTGAYPENCDHSLPPDCYDANECTIDYCVGPYECAYTYPPDCDDNNVCTTDACTGPYPEDCSHVPSPLSQSCGTSDACMDRVCDPVSGCFEHDRSSECGTSETCVERGCDPATGCFERDREPKPPECEGPQPGCRITAGGMTPDGGVDTAEFADSINTRFGGQVGAACGCIGCSDSLSPIQGSWETSRKARRGSFRALDFNSLVCGCDGVLDGELCRPGDGELGPEPRLAPANMACFSGVGNYNPTNGRRDIRVAFRVEVEDRGQPGVGKAALDDLYRIRIWIPGQGETAEGLAEQVCCTHAAPVGRQPDIDDVGNLEHGNIEIHPPLATTEKGTCPPPNGICQQ